MSDCTKVHVQFGTSGHRGIIGDTFTTAHVDAIVYAVVQIIRKKAWPKHVIVGYDCRTGNSGKTGYAMQVATRLIQAGLRVQVSDQPVPTPVVSDTIRAQGAGLGIMLTASHNPPQYNGLKINVANGAPAPAALTTDIQTIANTAPSQAPVLPVDGQTVSFVEAFAHRLVSAINDRFGRPKIAGPIVVDHRHGTSAQTWRALGAALGLDIIHCHAEPRSDFGGLDPNPVSESVLATVGDTVRAAGAIFGVAHDPDADRFAIVDADGVACSPEQICIIIAQYWVNHGHGLAGVATTVASSGLVQAFCQYHGCAYYETAVGFKHFSPVFECEQAGTVFAVESSGGVSASWHTYEKCGFLPAVLMAAIVGNTGQSVAQHRDTLSRYGSFFFRETAITVSDDQKQRIASGDNLTHVLSVLGKHGAVNRVDGIKVSLDNGWVLWRCSGTEPVVRVYSEGHTANQVSQWLQAIVPALQQ